MTTSTLKPWYAVATPHEDIREGRLSEAVFAANLWAVVQDAAPDVYCDPQAFFAKTYLTAGLTNVLNKVSLALAGGADAGDRILSLQTSFGGGKTHALVALWHLAKHFSVSILTCHFSKAKIGRRKPSTSLSLPTARAMQRRVGRRPKAFTRGRCGVRWHCSWAVWNCIAR